MCLTATAQNEYKTEFCHMWFYYVFILTFFLFNLDPELEQESSDGEGTAEEPTVREPQFTASSAVNSLFQLLQLSQKKS